MITHHSSSVVAENFLYTAKQTINAIAEYEVVKVIFFMFNSLTYMVLLFCEWLEQSFISYSFINVILLGATNYSYKGTGKLTPIRQMLCTIFLSIRDFNIKVMFYSSFSNNVRTAYIDFSHIHWKHLPYIQWK